MWPQPKQAGRRCALPQAHTHTNTHTHIHIHSLSRTARPRPSSHSVGDLLASLSRWPQPSLTAAPRPSPQLIDRLMRAEEVSAEGSKAQRRRSGAAVSADDNIARCVAAAPLSRARVCVCVCVCVLCVLCVSRVSGRCSVAPGCHCHCLPLLNQMFGALGFWCPSLCGSAPTSLSVRDHSELSSLARESARSCVRLSWVCISACARLPRSRSRPRPQPRLSPASLSASGFAIAGVLAPSVCLDLDLACA